jgi:hypothetical protein
VTAVGQRADGLARFAPSAAEGSSPSLHPPPRASTSKTVALIRRPRIWTAATWAASAMLGRRHRLGLHARRLLLVQNYIYPRATFGEEPWATKLKAPPDELIPMFRREDIHVVVVGGETNGYWRIMGCNYQKTVSVDDCKSGAAGGGGRGGRGRGE